MNEVGIMTGRSRRWVLVGAALALLGLVAAGCGSTGTAPTGEASTGAAATGPAGPVTTLSHGDAEVFVSVEDLALQSDVVAVGQITGEREAVLESGVVPMVYATVRIEEVLKAPDSLRDLETWTVSVPDWTVQREEGISSELVPGRAILIFGEFIPADTAPISLPAPGVVGPVGGVAGLFDVSGDRAVARAPELLGAERAEAELRLRAEAESELLAEREVGRSARDRRAEGGEPPSLLEVPLQVVRDLSR